MLVQQPRWPRGTPVAPGGQGPGGGRWRGKPGVELGGWAGRVAARLALAPSRFTRGMLSHEQVASYLYRTDYRVFGRAGGAYGDVEFREYSDGTRLAYKAQAVASDRFAIENEVETSLIARAIGVPAPAVVEDPDAKAAGGAVLMQWFPAVDPDFWRDADADFKSDSGRMIGLLDVLVGNSDRNPSNYLVGEDGVVVAIDHGLTLYGDRYKYPDKRDELDAPELIRAARFGSPFASRLFTLGEDGQHLQGWFSREAIREARRHIQEIESLIRADRFAGVMKVLDLLEGMSWGDNMLG